MENLVYSFNVVMPVFLVIGLGYLLKQINMIDDHFADVALKFNFRVALPLLIFKNIYTSDFKEVFNPKLMVYGLLAIICSALLLWVIVPRFIKDGKRASAIIQGSFRGNFLLLGLPLAINMFGADKVQTITTLAPMSTPTFNLLAVIVLAAFDNKSDKENSRKVLTATKSIITNPLIIVSFAALLLLAISFEIPTFVMGSVSSISALATPLALITLGAQLNFKNVGRNLKYSSVAVVIKLIVLPLVNVLPAIAMGFRGPALGGIFMLFASSSSVSCFVMSKEMNSDHELSADIIILSTFFSMFTIFVGVFLLKTFSLI